MNASETADLFRRSDRDTAIDVLHAATALYTQDPIVLQLLDQVAWPAGAGTLLDTSCGDGAFLGRALARLLETYPAISDEDLRGRLEGWEIHFFAASEARQRLQRVLIEHGREPSSASALASQMIRCGDFLTEGPRQGEYQAVVGNPPYLRMLNVPDPLRGEYEHLLPDYARADLLHSFLDRCAAILAADGELAMVTADRWLFNEGAARVREVVGQHFGLASVTRLDADSAFYRPKLRRAGTPPRIHPVAVVLKSRAEAVQPIGRAPIYPDECRTIGPATPTEVLNDVADIRLAPWLGTPGIFLIDAAVSSNWPVGTTVPAIDTDDIQGGVLTPPRRRAIVTRPEETPAPEVLAHLDRELPRMCARGRAAIRWMPPEPFHRLDLSQPSLLVPRIAKTLKPVRVPAGVLPVNHNLSIVRAASMTLDDLEELLNSRAANAWVERRAARLENGYHSLTTRLLRTMPVFHT